MRSRMTGENRSADEPCRRLASKGEAVKFFGWCFLLAVLLASVPRVAAAGG